MQITNQAQLRRTVESLVETGRLIERELAYQPKFRNAEHLAFLEQHSAKLASMISEYREG